MGALGALLLARRIAHADGMWASTGSNPWSGAADLPHTVHSVSKPHSSHWAPDIGYVTDADHNTVCYFFRNHHWWEGQAHLSCVYVSGDFLLEETPVR